MATEETKVDIEKQKKIESSRVQNLKNEIIEGLSDPRHVADNLGSLYAFLKSNLETVEWYMKQSGIYPLPNKK